MLFSLGHSSFSCSQKAVQRNRGARDVEPEHVLATLVALRDGIVREVLRKLEVDQASVTNGLQTELGKRPQAHGGAQPSLSPRLPAVAKMAEANRAPEGRVRQHGAPTDRTGRRGGPISQRTTPETAPRHPGRDLPGAHGCPWIPTCDRPEPRRKVPGARALRPRPDRPGSA